MSSKFNRGVKDVLILCNEGSLYLRNIPRHIKREVIIETTRKLFSRVRKKKIEKLNRVCYLLHENIPLFFIDNPEITLKEYNWEYIINYLEKTKKIV